MLRMRWYIRAALAGVLAVSTASAERGRGAASKPAPGSVARQLMLKYRLRKIADGTLTASLNHNRIRWERMTPERREEYRRDMAAFLGKSPQSQEALLKHYEDLTRFSVEKQAAYQKRAAWLKVVVARMAPHERKALREMSPSQRARKLLQRRDELVRTGKLPLGKPSKRPTSAPAGKTAPQK